MSPLRLPIRTLCLPSSQSETTFRLQRLPPPGSDTRGVVTRFRAVLRLALLRLPAVSRCRDSYSVIKVRGEPHCVRGSVVTSRKDCSSPSVTRPACFNYSRVGGPCLVGRIGRGLPDASILTTLQPQRQQPHGRHRNARAYIPHQCKCPTFVYKFRHPLRCNGSHRFPQVER